MNLRILNKYRIKLPPHQAFYRQVLANSLRQRRIPCVRGSPCARGIPCVTARGAVVGSRWPSSAVIIYCWPCGAFVIYRWPSCAVVGPLWLCRADKLDLVGDDDTTRVIRARAVIRMLATREYPRHVVVTFRAVRVIGPVVSRAGRHDTLEDAAVQRSVCRDRSREEADHDLHVSQENRRHAVP